MRTVVFAALALAALAPGQNFFSKAPPEVEEALRTRVSQFYSLYQQAQFRKAEALVAEESRDLYYTMPKAPIRGFEVENIDWEDGFESAIVLVKCLSVTPRTASEGIWIPILGKWKLANKDWFLLIKPREGSPFGKMNFADPRDFKPQTSPSARPTPEMLRNTSFVVEPQRVVFPKGEAGPVRRTIQVTNTLPGVLVMNLGDPKIPGMTVTAPDLKIGPQRSVTIEIAYDPAAGKLTGVTRELRIEMQPTNREVAIQLVFE